TLVVYASSRGSPRPTQDSLLAAGQALPGGIGYPQGSDERFPSHVMFPFPLSQALPDARTTKLSSGAGWRDVKPRNAVMPAPSAAATCSAAEELMPVGYQSFVGRDSSGPVESVCVPPTQRRLSMSRVATFSLALAIGLATLALVS